MTNETKPPKKCDCNYFICPHTFKEPAAPAPEAAPCEKCGATHLSPEQEADRMRFIKETSVKRTPPAPEAAPLTCRYCGGALTVWRHEDRAWVRYEPQHERYNNPKCCTFPMFPTEDAALAFLTNHQGEKKA